MSRNKLAIEILNEVLFKNGFNRKCKEWSLYSDEIILIIGGQKSSFDYFVYLNIGIWLNELSSHINIPKERECHIRTRLENLFTPSPESAVPQICQNTSDEEFERALRILLKEFLIPMLSHLTSTIGLKQLYRNKTFSKSLICCEAKELLSITD